MEEGGEVQGHDNVVGMYEAEGLTDRGHDFVVGMYKDEDAGRDVPQGTMTPQEAGHHLKGAKVFSEFDIGNGFHQVPLATYSQVIFQSHLGLHGTKRLFFGPTNSSGMFHHEVTKLFAGLRGCITIHNNLLVFWV